MTNGSATKRDVTERKAAKTDAGGGNGATRRGRTGPLQRKEVEREISSAIIRFEKEFMGRGPLETRTFIIDDMVLVRLKGVLTPAEHKLGQGGDQTRGRRLIKQMRRELIENGRPLIDSVIRDIVGLGVVSLHTDLSTKTGERIIVLTLEAPIPLAD